MLKLIILYLHICIHKLIFFKVVIIIHLSFYQRENPIIYLLNWIHSFHVIILISKLIYIYIYIYIYINKSKCLS